MLTAVIIKLSRPIVRYEVTFNSIDELDISSNPSFLIFIKLDSNNILDSIMACCRINAMGGSSALLNYSNIDIAQHTNGISIFKKEPSIKSNKPLIQDRSILLNSIYDQQTAKALLNSKNISLAKEEIEKSHQEPWNIVLTSAELSFALKCKESILASPMDRFFMEGKSAIFSFLIAMYCLFSFSIILGKKIQSWFVNSINYVLSLIDILPDKPFINNIFKAITGGIETVASFLPLIWCMYLFLSFLEKSGYMARAIRMVDSLVSNIGLSGRAFVPLITGFGCNVPAIISTNSITDKNERITTIMMVPFMACSARLSVFILLSSIFFTNYAHNIVFVLYLTGIAVALLTAKVFKRNKKMQKSYIALPLLLIPSPFELLKLTTQKTYLFLTEAGKMIFILFVAIYLLNCFPQGNNKLHQDSLLVMASKKITPIFSPMGIKQDNWGAIAAIVTGTIAKESIVGTMQAAYGEGEAGIKNMRSKFDGSLGVFCYLLFVLLYFPCASVFITITKQLNYKWALISVCWSNIVAYAVATLTYQISSLIIKTPLHFLAPMLAITIFLIYALLNRKHYNAI